MEKYVATGILYKKFKELEDEAFEMCEKTDPGTQEYKIWTAILTERTSFKYDLMDAPAADVVPVIHAKWIKGRYCSNCECDDYDYCCRQPKYCPECGAIMDEETK